jgi:hypothetical protein
MVLADNVLAMGKIGGWSPGSIVFWVAFPQNLVLKLLPTSAANKTVVEDSINFPLWFVVNHHRGWRRMMASRKPGGLDMVVLQLRHMEDGVDAHVGRERQLVGNWRDDGGDPEGAKPSRC